MADFRPIMVDHFPTRDLAVGTSYSTVLVKAAWGIQMTLNHRQLGASIAKSDVHDSIDFRVA